MRLPLVLAALLLSPLVRADDWKFKAGAKGTVGSEHYGGSEWWGRAAKDQWSFKPKFSEYGSDASSGTYKTVSARGGYDTDAFGVGLSVGGTPKVNGYSNGFFGVDGVVTLEPDKGSKAPAWELGGAFKRTTHRDDLQAAVTGQAGRRGEPTRPRANSVSIGENEFILSGDAVFDFVEAGVDLDKSFYDQDLASLNARAAQAVQLSGVAATVQGFPDASETVRAEFPAVPYATPTFSYTHTSYELSQPDSNALTVGAYGDAGPWQVSGSFERFTQAGQPGQSYWSLGLTYKFY